MLNALRRLRRVSLVLSVSLAVSGCFVAGPFPIPLVRPARPAPGNAPPTPVVPALYIEYAGNRAMAEESAYRWRTGNVDSAGSSQPGGATPLALPLGDGLNIVVNFNPPPAVLWVAELDGNGVPRAASVLTPTAMTTVYTPTVGGRYRLRVTAEWTDKNTVTGLFPLEVRP